MTQKGDDKIIKVCAFALALDWLVHSIEQTRKHQTSEEKMKRLPKSQSFVKISAKTIIKAMIKKIIATISLASVSVTVALPSQGEVVQKYDEFTGKTTISVVPDNWDGKTPRLFLNYSFQGKTVTKLRGLSLLCRA